MGDQEFDIRLSERVAKLEAKVGNIEKDVEPLGTIEKAITEISATLKFLTELMHKNFDEVHKKVDSLDNNIHTKVDDLEKQINCNEEKSKIDVRTLIKDIIVTKIIPIGGLLLLGYEISKLKF